MKETAKKKFNDLRKIIDEHLDKYIRVVYPETIYNSMRYSLLNGGKRLRPVLAVETALIYGAEIEQILPCACAIEMLHCQSLIHDDLPCMDDDDYRRGKLSNHKVFGEAIATLAGDAFLSFAPEIIIDKTPKTVKPTILLDILREFFLASGTDGIISGQVVDIESENKIITKETLEFIHEYKTARLFKFAIRAGAIIANVNRNTLQNLTLFAQYYGNAFQIYDDILDAASTLEDMGKTPGKDEKAGKATYVTMYNLEVAKKQLMFLCNQAYDILKKERINSEILEGVVSDIVTGVDKCF